MYTKTLTVRWRGKLYEVTYDPDVPAVVDVYTVQAGRMVVLPEIDSELTDIIYASLE